MPSIRPLVSAIALASSLIVSTPTLADTLRVAIMGEPASLDPHQVSGVWENDVVGDLFEGLVTEDRDVKRIPGVAKSWDISDDGKVYTFHLREDAKWSDGEALTAEDFVFSWRRLLDPNTAANYAYLLYPVQGAEAINKGKADVETLGVRAVDEHTLEVTLTNSTPYFLDQLSHYTAYPLPEHVLKKYGSDWIREGHLVSNGAFKLDQWRSQNRIEASKNEYFHDADNVALDDIIYYPIEDRNAALNRFRGGEVDIAREFPTQQYQWLKENLPDETHVAPYLGIYYMALNSRDGHPTNDVRVREALNLATRRDVISNNILKIGTIPAWSIVPQGINNYEIQEMPGHDMSSEERMSRARELLSEAGYGPDKPLDLVATYNTSDDHRKVLVALAAMWKPLGVNLELRNAEVAVHYANLRQGDFDVGRAGWIGDYNDPQNFLSLFETGVPNNYGAYSNPEFDQLMKQAATTLDMTERAHVMEHAEQVMLDDFAALPIYYYVSRNLVSTKLKGWEDNIEDIHRSRWISIEQ